MKKVVFWMAVLALCLLMGFSVAMAGKAKEAQVEALVEKAAASFKEKGKEALRCFVWVTLSEYKSAVISFG